MSKCRWIQQERKAYGVKTLYQGNDSQLEQARKDNPDLDFYKVLKHEYGLFHTIKLGTGEKWLMQDDKVVSRVFEGGV